MASISSPGLGSGLDVNSIVSKLVAVESQPLQILQKKATAINTDISAYGQIKSNLSDLQTAVQALTDGTLWLGKAFTSSNSAVSGTASASAPTGTFAVQVSTLATAQTTASTAITAGSAIGAGGRLDIQLGSWSGTSFTAGSSSVASISVASTDTMASIAAKINAANAGVSATVISGASGDQLTLISTATGIANGFQIRSYDGSSTEITDGTTGVGKLAYNTSAGTSYGMTRTQTAIDTTGTLNGISISSSNLTIANAVSGLTLTVNATTSTPAQVVVSSDTASMKSKLQSFVDTYNKVNSSLRTLTKYDAATKTGGPLQGDGLITGLQTMLRNLIGTIGPSGTGFTRLSDMGIQIQRDGSLQISDTKLSSALGNTTNVRNFLTAAATGSSPAGVMGQLNSFLTTALGTTGAIATGTTGLQKSLDSNQKSMDSLNAHIAAYQKQITSQFNALDTKMSSLTSLSSFVSQQITQWNKSG